MSQHELTVDKDSEGLRLDVFLNSALLEVKSRSFAKRLIDDGCVLIDDKALKAHHKVRSGERLFVEIPESLLSDLTIEPEDIPLDIFYEDENLLLINKPAGVLVHPTSSKVSGTLVNALLHHCPQLSDINTKERPGIVHRLDQDTSGLMVVAKDNATHQRLAKQFAHHAVQKKYLALVQGDVEFEEGIVDAPLGRDPIHRENRRIDRSDLGKDSITRYKVLARLPGTSYIALYPRTGRTHQLRVHMAHLGHPILGDAKYGQKKSFSRLALHAQSLGFEHPAQKTFVEFMIPPPIEFIKAMKRK